MVSRVTSYPGCSVEIHQSRDRARIATPKQFFRHTSSNPVTICECFVKVFNSSVENCVENGPVQIEIAHRHKAYPCLHKFGAVTSACKREFFLLVLRCASPSGRKNYGDEIPQ